MWGISATSTSPTSLSRSCLNTCATTKICRSPDAQSSTPCCAVKSFLRNSVGATIFRRHRSETDSTGSPRAGGDKHVGVLKCWMLTRGNPMRGVVAPAPASSQWGQHAEITTAYGWMTRLRGDQIAALTLQHPVYAKSTGMRWAQPVNN